MAENAVLYVDDEWSNRVVFEQTFTSRFRVLTAASGAAALEILARETVAIVVADQRMPEMSGNELLGHVREHYPSIIRMVLTAYGDLDPILRAVNDGLVARYLLKPWDPEELGRLLDWGLEAYEMGSRQSAVQLRLLKTERLVTIGTLTATLFHDLKNALSHCRNNTQRLLELSRASSGLAQLLVAADPAAISPVDRRLLANLAEELPSLAEDLDAGGKMVDDLAESVNRLMKPTDTPEETSEPVRVVKFVLDVYRGGMRGIQIAWTGPAALPRVKIGMTELAQVLLNLVTNSVHAIGTENRGRIEIRGFAQETAVQLQVVDNGPGMTPEVRAKAGTMFFSTQKEGTGLGLSNCRRLVERVGGTLSIESSPGAGTTVSVVVPAITSP